MEPKKPQLNDAVGALLIRYAAEAYNVDYRVNLNFNSPQRFRIFRTFLISRRFPSILLRSVDDKAYKPKHYKDPCLKFIIKSVAFYSSRYFGHDIHLQEIPISMARILVALSDVQRLQLEFLTTRTSRQVVGEWQRLCLALKDHRTLKAIEVNVFDSNTLSFQILMDNVSEKIVCVYAYKKPIAYHLEQSSKQLEKFVFNNRNWRTVQTPDLVCLLAVHARKLVLEDLNFLIFTLPDVRPLKRNEFVRVLKIKNDMVENFVRFFHNSEFISKFDSLMRTIRGINDHLTMTFKLSEKIHVVLIEQFWVELSEMMSNARKMINFAALANMPIQKLTITVLIDDVDFQLEEKELFDYFAYELGGKKIKKFIDDLYDPISVAFEFTEESTKLLVFPCLSS